MPFNKNAFNDENGNTAFQYVTIGGGLPTKEHRQQTQAITALTQRSDVLTLLHSTAQHSTTQHSTTPHRTALHSTALHRTA
jgi:hypothetical protein